MFVRACFLALGLVATAGPVKGCGDDPPQQRVTEYGVCKGGLATPLSAQAVVQVLRAHGFSVRASTNSAECEGFDPSMPSDEIPVIAVSNDLAGTGSAASDSEGWMSCLLRRGPIWGAKPRIDLKAPPNSPIFNGRKAEFSFANVECSLYPSDDDHADAQIGRAGDAFRALVARGK